MALIVCRNCGKKVSDTVVTCIHCGWDMSRPEVYDGEEKSVDTQEVKTAISQPVSYPRYDELNDEKRKKLESDFLKQDRWAYKYRQRKTENPVFAKMLVIYLGFVVIYTSIMSSLDVFVTDVILNETAWKYAIVCLVLLIGLTLGALLYSIAMRVYLKQTHASWLYIKKYQMWLMKENGIEYIPDFKNREERELYDAITIDK